MSNNSHDRRRKIRRRITEAKTTEARKNRFFLTGVTEDVESQENSNIHSDELKIANQIIEILATHPDQFLSPLQIQAFLRSPNLERERIDINIEELEFYLEVLSEMQYLIEQRGNYKCVSYWT